MQGEQSRLIDSVVHPPACPGLSLMPPPHHVPSIASILCSTDTTPSSTSESAMDSPSNATGSDQAAQPDTRPPGGTRRSGNKTPRRVQWMSDERPNLPSPRALDEHGLDVRLYCPLSASPTLSEGCPSPSSRRRSRLLRMHSNATGPHQQTGNRPPTLCLPGL